MDPVGNYAGRREDRCDPFPSIMTPRVAKDKQKLAQRNLGVAHGKVARLAAACSYRFHCSVAVTG